MKDSVTAGASRATSRSVWTRPSKLMDQLRQMEELERELRSASDPESLQNIDPEEVRRLLGDDAAQQLEQLQQLDEAARRSGLPQARWRQAGADRQGRSAGSGRRRCATSSASCARTPSASTRSIIEAPPGSGPTRTSRTRSAIRSTCTSSRRYARRSCARGRHCR